jgi:hypothetical protein
MKTAPGRRSVLMTIGLGMVAGATGFAALPDGAASAAEPSLLPPAAKSLEELTARLKRAPRRRDFKTVPMILNDPDQWDHAALSEVIAYRGAPKQVWDNTGIASPWLNDMRNALNTQVWSFKNPDFLVVSATHGTAHLALFGRAMLGEIPACETDRRQIPEQHAGRGAEGCRRRPERLREPRRRLLASRQLHPGAAATRRRLHRLSQRDMGVCGDADRHRGEP